MGERWLGALGLLAMSVFIVVFHVGFLHGQIPVGHDGQAVMSGFQYLFGQLNQHHELPLWVPELLHGSPGGVLLSSATIGQRLVLLLAPFWNGNGFDATHLSFALDELVLLWGLWLLTGLLFRQVTTRLFVCAGVVLPLTVQVQPVILYLPYLVPLHLALGGLYLLRGRRWALVAAFILMGFQAVMAVPYFTPLISFVVTMFMVPLLLGCRKTLTDRFKQQGEWLTVALALVSGGVAVAISKAFIDRSLAPFVSVSMARSADGSVPLDVFLTYGGSTSLWRWAELLLGHRVVTEFTLWMGAGALGLAVAGLFGRRTPTWWATSISLLVNLGFASGTIVAVVAYHFWPMMQMFRHISYDVHLVRLFWVLLAGFGFQMVFFERNKMAILAGFTTTVAVLGAQLVILNDEALLLRVLMVTGYMMPLKTGWQREVLMSGLALGAGWSVVWACLLLVARRWGSRVGPVLALVALAATVADTLVYRFRMAPFENHALTGEQYALGKAPPAAYQPRRISSFMPTPEMALFGDYINTQTRSIYAQYAGFDLLWRRQAARATARADLIPVAIHDLGTFVVEQGSLPIWRPETWIPLAKTPPEPHWVDGLIGLSRDKIGFADGALGAVDVGSMEDLLIETQGEQLVVLGPEQGSGLPVEVDWGVEHYSPNRLVLALESGVGAGTFLSWADAYDPGWRAWVDGAEAEVLRANIGYKAIPLSAGAQQVELRYQAPWLKWGTRLFAGLAVAVFLMLTVWVFRDLRQLSEGPAQ